MTYLLGIDTGGTYTDAVILREESEVIASAKSLTTREDLALGIGRAVQSVLSTSGISAAQIAMASLSTTLATNALVEGQGDRIALVYIGFRNGDIAKSGLSEALKGDPYLELKGGHSHSGSEICPLDEAALSTWITGLNGVSAYAVASQFATRNPAHELRTAEIIKEITGKPVSASHQLSAKLNGPKRALTALLNARLIGMIDRLIRRAGEQLQSLGIQAPLMVVRGDGALISKDQAREKPIETILSGPAASIVGARWLTGAEDALVSDIGGTTTDVALLKKGRPAIDPMGAQVGPYRTMVEAVAMRTTGLGGDSEVHFQVEGLAGGVFLGPKRVLPVSLAAIEQAQIVHDALDAQLKSTLPGEYDGRFVRKTTVEDPSGFTDRDRQLWLKLTNRFLPLGQVLTNRLESQALSRLVSRGVAQIAALTPSDASHVLGYTDAWDKDAAEKALLLFGRRRTGAGVVLSTNAHDLAQRIVDQLTYQTTIALLEAAFGEEEVDFGASPLMLAAQPLLQKGLLGHRGIVKIDAGLNIPVVGLGASAPTYYPAVGHRLNCDMILPEHAGVANAIGAVVGRVTMRASGTITSPSEGHYRVHLRDSLMDFGDEEEALLALEQALCRSAQSAAHAAGAEDVELDISRDIRKATVENRNIFVEAQVQVTATGRPRVANL